MNVTLGFDNGPVSEVVDRVLAAAPSPARDLFFVSANQPRPSTIAQGVST